MPQVLEYTVYQFDELSDKAKEKARQWYASSVFSDSYDWEFVYEDAARMAEILGIDLRQRPVKLVGGGTLYKPAIFFSGFWSQGDGACFEGDYRYKPGALKAIKTAAPNDTDLHSIAKQLQQVQARHFYKLRATMRHSGHYYHSGCMSVDVAHYDDNYRDIGSAEEDIRQLMRDFADWIYDQLKKEYNWLTSDEQVEESIRANEYTFDEDGNRED